MDWSRYFNPRSPHGERHLFGSLPSCLMVFQSTLPARGATRLMFSFVLTAFRISIHAPRTGSDQAGRAGVSKSAISIHAPRTGSDMASFPADIMLANHFNPRSPHGERQRPLTRAIKTFSFQSTLPARGATCAVDQPHAGDGISIHAPRTGSDETQL